MRIVVDANVLIAALAKASTTRELLLYPFMAFYTPAFSLTELQKHKKEIALRLHLGSAGYKGTLALILSNVRVVEEANYRNRIKAALGVIGKIDKDDVPYVALSISIKAYGVWTYDSDFEKQDRIRVLRTKDISRLIFQYRNI